MIPDTLTLEQHDALGRLALEDLSDPQAPLERQGAAQLLLETGEWQGYWLALVLTEQLD